METMEILLKEILVVLFIVFICMPGLWGMLWTQYRNKKKREKWSRLRELYTEDELILKLDREGRWNEV